MAADLDISHRRSQQDSDPIAALQAALRRYPQAHYDLSSDRVVVEPIGADGFRVAFFDLRGRFRVACAGWQADFDDVETAVGCFTSALTTSCRLKVWRRGGRPHRWELQTFREDQWVVVGSVGLLFYAFWRRPELAFLQNRFSEAV
jgi:hypothetical protein